MATLCRACRLCTADGKSVLTDSESRGVTNVDIAGRTNDDASAKAVVVDDEEPLIVNATTPTIATSRSRMGSGDGDGDIMLAVDMVMVGQV